MPQQEFLWLKHHVFGYINTSIWVFVTKIGKFVQNGTRKSHDGGHLCSLVLKI